MSIASDLSTLYHLTLKPISGETHAARLESFYGSQAKNYDSFRERLLHGRDDLLRIITSASGHWVDLGAGTGRNVERAEQLGASFSRISLVDLSPSLLKVASSRLTETPTRALSFHLADATATGITPGSVDVVTLSYSLTMIPNWFAALEHALELLKPGGTLGVVDFYHSRKRPEPGRVKHSWAKRVLPALWFAADDVNLSADHLPWLCSHLDPSTLIESEGAVPYLPLCKVPYYVFVGSKK